MNDLIYINGKWIESCPWDKIHGNKKSMISKEDMDHCVRKTAYILWEPEKTILDTTVVKDSILKPLHMYELKIH